MTNVEQRANDYFPVRIEVGRGLISYDVNEEKRFGYIHGFMCALAIVHNEIRARADFRHARGFECDNAIEAELENVIKFIDSQTEQV